MGHWIRVKKNDTLKKIGKRTGVSAKRIKDDDLNESLWKSRTVGMLKIGDRLWIPEKEEKAAAVPTGTPKTFAVADRTTELEIRLWSHELDPLAGTAYTLTAGKKVFKGKAESDGTLRHKIPVADGGSTIDEATLVLDDLGLRWLLKIGDLDPLKDAADAADVSGAKGRLDNLGFKAGAIDDTVDKRLGAAVKAFQRLVLRSEKPSGDLDADTLSALEDQYGS